MEIVREFKKPLSQRVVLNIPEDFVKKELEILIIPVNKKRKTKPVDNKRELFEKLCGLWEGRTDISLKEIRERAWKRA